MPGYIDPTTERSGYIEAPLPNVPGHDPLHEPLSFTYRNAARKECLLLDGEVHIATRRSDEDPNCFYAGERLIYQFVASHLKTWSLVDHNGNAVAVNPENVERVHPELQGKLYSIIRGNSLPDRKPVA